MTKIKRLVVLFITLLSSIMVLSSCMVARDVMPEGFEEVIEGFDIFTTKIRLVRYVVPQNTLDIELTLKLDKITREDAWKLLEVLTEYFRTEKFAEFVDDVQEIDDGYFSISLHLFNANNVRDHLTGVRQSSNFGDWGGGFEYMWKNEN